MTLSTFVLLVVVATIVVLPFIGRHLLKRNPKSDLGLRLMALGSDLRALGSSPVADLLPPPVRAALRSIPESDPPRGER